LRSSPHVSLSSGFCLPVRGRSAWSAPVQTVSVSRRSNVYTKHATRGENRMMHLMALHASLRARLAAREEGQGMVEYGLIIAAVAIAVIVAVFALGPKIASMFNSAGASLSSDRNKKANFA